jgi:uncharacterized protein YndB with AHSA1/START domain/uncharacterized protein YciI
MFVGAAGLSAFADGPAPDRGESTERMIRKEVVVAAPVADVWRSWTTRAGIRSFFGRDAWVELRVGGAYEVYFVPDAPAGSRGSEGCRVLAYVPEEMLAFSWSAPPSMPEMRSEQTQVVVRLAPVGERSTRVSLVHLGWGQGAQGDKAYAYFEKAWSHVLGQLKVKHAVSGAPPEPREQFAIFLEPARPTFAQDATEEENERVAAHFRQLQRMLDAGTLILAGRTQESCPTGIVVFEAEDLAAAQRVLAEDAAVKAGVFKGRVVPYRVALMRGGVN